MGNLMSVHFEQRLKERYGLELSESDAESIIQLILKGFAKFLGTNATGRERYIVGFGGHLIDVVYDPTDNLLITAYPSSRHTLVASLRKTLSDFLLASS